MRILIIFFAICLSANKLYAKSYNYIDYFTYTSKAKYFLNINNIDSSIIYFEKSFSLVNKNIPFDEFLLARNYALKNNPSKCYYWLKKSINGGIVYNYFKKIRDDSVFDILSPKQKQKISKLDSKMLTFYENDANVNKLRDSIFYYFYNDSYLMGGTNKKNALKFGGKYIDTTIISYSQFQNLLVNYIIKNGYPGLKKNTSDILSIPLWHLSVENKIKLKPFLIKELQLGNITPDDYAGFIEKLEYELNSESCTYYFIIKSCDLKYWGGIIENRKLIGMSIYLENGDYSYYTFLNRSKLPWIK